MPYKSPWPSQAPYAPMSCRSSSRQTVRRVPDKAALHLGARASRARSRSTGRRREEMARALQDRGIEKGDTIGIYAPNSAEYAVALHGALHRGRDGDDAEPAVREREVEHQLGDAGAKAAFTLGAARAGGEGGARSELPKLKHIFELEQAWEMVQRGEGRSGAGRARPGERRSRCCRTHRGRRGCRRA